MEIIRRRESDVPKVVFTVSSFILWVYVVYEMMN